MIQIPTELEARFAKDELIPAIAQSASDGKVLMLAWMNKAALELTISSGYATYWSRSRNELWKKGETSGNLQKVESVYFDCDSDSLLIKVNQSGPACHTGEESCFHNCIQIEK